MDAGKAHVVQKSHTAQYPGINQPRWKRPHHSTQVSKVDLFTPSPGRQVGGAQGQTPQCWSLLALLLGSEDLVRKGCDQSVPQELPLL